LSKNIQIAFSEEYVLPLPPDHKFPIQKYSEIPKRLLKEGVITHNNLFPPGICDLSIVKLTHTKDYVNKLLNLNLSDREIRKIGFPQSNELVIREFIITNGTVKGAISAINNGAALNIAGGTHHAFADSGEGFCLLNDVAVAANYLLHRGFANKILIVDLDVHQGNGTAKIFENDSRVFTFSMHGKDNYPLQKETSDLDIPLKHGIGDDEYLQLLNNNLPLLIEKVNPDFIFYISGVDILKTDRWGKLGLSTRGCLERDKLVINQAHENRIPIMISMGGGYSPNLDDIVVAHCNTFRHVFKIYQ
jgi:acetoin utilization deacetylase AcuC-like enzyme